MRILIDSSVLIAWERNQLNLEAQLADNAEEDFAISAIIASEWPHGVHRATAMTKGYIVTARDERSLPRIPGLRYQRW